MLFCLQSSVIFYRVWVVFSFCEDYEEVHFPIRNRPMAHGWVCQRRMQTSPMDSLPRRLRRPTQTRRKSPEASRASASDCITFNPVRFGSATFPYQQQGGGQVTRWVHIKETIINRGLTFSLFWVSSPDGWEFYFFLGRGQGWGCVKGNADYFTEMVVWYPAGRGHRNDLARIE